MQRALTDGVALQWFSVGGSGHDEALIQMTNMDLRAGTAELHVQILRPDPSAEVIRADLKQAIHKAGSGWPLRRLHCRIAASWTPQYREWLPDHEMEGELKDYYFLSGRLEAQQILTVILGMVSP